MSLQFIKDTEGNTTGVFIPIDEWQSLKNINAVLDQKEAETAVELAPWQKQLIDKRLNDYYQNPFDMMDFDKTIDDIEEAL
jgi:hypothetical protein